MDFEKLLNKAKKINIDKIMAKILKGLEPEIIDLNILQLSKGEGASGSKLPEYKNEKYFKAKQSEGLTEQAGKHWNILLTGDTRDSMYTRRTGKDTYIFAKTDYILKLDKLANQDIFGLQEKNLQQLINNEIEPELVNELQKAH